MAQEKQENPRSPKEVRIKTTELSVDGGTDISTDNGDNKPPYILNFTKGLAHGLNGLLKDPSDYEDFARGTEFHDPEPFSKTEPFREEFYTDRVNGNDSEAMKDDSNYRQWESPTAGHAYVLEGPDP